MNGPDELIFLGLAVDQVGDVNGDDIPDIVVAAAGAPPFHAPSAIVSGSDGSTHSRLHDLPLHNSVLEDQATGRFKSIIFCIVRVPQRATGKIDNEFPVGYLISVAAGRLEFFIKLGFGNSLEQK